MKLYVHLETILQKPVFIPENIFEMLLLFYSPAAWRTERSWTVRHLCGRDGQPTVSNPETHHSSINWSINRYLKTNNWSICLFQPPGFEDLQLFFVTYDRKWRECVWDKRSSLETENVLIYFPLLFFFFFTFYFRINWGTCRSSRGVIRVSAPVIKSDISQYRT